MRLPVFFEMLKKKNNFNTNNQIKNYQRKNDIIEETIIKLEKKHQKVENKSVEKIL